MIKRYKNYENKLDWLKRNKKFSFYFDNEFFVKNTDYVKSYLETLTKQPTSSQFRTIALLCDLSLLYTDDIDKKYREYKKETSTKKKLEIRYGRDRVSVFEEKLRNKPKPIINSYWTVKYWMNKGLTEEEAKKKISEIQSENSKKGKGKITNYKILSPLSVEYWKHQGFTDKEEIERLRRPYLDKCTNRLSRYIEKYGEEKGLEVFQNGINRRHQTMLERYGAKVPVAGVSKESLRFLIKVYKILRKNGIDKNDIVWGISGRKEFVLTDFTKKRSYFYDFVIKSKKVIIEYNNLFWHPREGEEWRGFADYSEAMDSQKLKEELAISRGYTVHYVWNDDDLEQKATYLSEVILNDRN